MGATRVIKYMWGDHMYTWGPYNTCHGNKYIPYTCRVLIFWWENPSLLDYDDVITLHH